MDNGTAQLDNSTAQGSAPSFSWKSSVRTDLKDSPLVNKFEDTPEGLNKALESHLNLEKLLGHEKVPLPKGDDDVEGWSRFSKALGVPDKADDYGLPDAELPDSMKEIAIDKKRFAEVVHKYKLTPAQAKGLWKDYVDINLNTYNSHSQAHQGRLAETVNALKAEWGDSYNSNVELGQSVINKFSGSKEMNDKITALLSQDPDGVKFLANIGKQFSENKIAGFQPNRFSLSPDEAKNEIQKILRDPAHPYNNPKATDKEHTEAVNYVNSLYAAINRAKG